MYPPKTGVTLGTTFDLHTTMQFKLATVTALLAAVSSALAVSEGVTVAAGIEKTTKKVADVAERAEDLNIRNASMKASVSHYSPPVLRS